MVNHVLTHHYDNARTGWNSGESVLTPLTVNQWNFGYLFQQTLDDFAHAQPLYLEGLKINGKTRNAVFAATEAGTLFAFDADHANNGQPLWMPLSIQTPGATNEARGGFQGTITPTPVIDPKTNTMYVLGYFTDTSISYYDPYASLYSNNPGANRTGAQFYRMHAIDLIAGQVKATSAPLYNPFMQVLPGSAQPPTLTIEVPGVGVPQNPNRPGYVFFDPNYQGSRPALLLVHGHVYAAFGSLGDIPPYHGWILAFSTAKLNVVHHFCTTPDGSYTPALYQQYVSIFGNDQDDPEIGGSFWQSGWGLAADDDGFIYGVSGNGLFFDEAGHPHHNYADSLLKMRQDLHLEGSFTRANELQLTEHDEDFGSAGCVVIPTTKKGEKFVVACGKDANVYLVDRTSLKRATLHQTAQTQPPQSSLTLIAGPETKPLPNLSGPPSAANDGAGPGVWGGPAYFGGSLGDVIYYCGDHGPLQSMQIVHGQLQSFQQTNTTLTSERFPNEGGIIPVVTSHGAAAHTAVVWGITRPDGNNIVRLRAYAAANLGQPNLADLPIATWNGNGGGAFLAPIIANGKAYVAAQSVLVVLGIIPNCSLIQSTFGAPGSPGNFEALIVQENRLLHYWRNNSVPGLTWHKTVAVTSAATGPACLIQSTIGTSGKPGNFEALVPEGSHLVHYWRNNSKPGFPWSKTVAVSSAATGPACLVQSTFGTPGHPGNFETLVLEGSNMVHYWRDNSTPGFPWSKSAIVSAAATGPACLIQSNFGSAGHPGNFEALVLEGANLVHYWRDNTTPGFPWNKTVTVSTAAVGPACLVQGTFGTPGNLEALVLESNPANQGLPPYNLVHYWRNDSAPGLPWNRGEVVSSIAIGPASLIQGSFHSGTNPGNFEVLVPEQGNTVSHYWRNNSDPTFPWSRDTVL